MIVTDNRRLNRGKHITRLFTFEKRILIPSYKIDTSAQILDVKQSVLNTKEYISNLFNNSIQGIREEIKKLSENKALCRKCSARIDEEPIANDVISQRFSDAFVEKTNRAASAASVSVSISLETPRKSASEGDVMRKHKTDRPTKKRAGCGKRTSSDENVPHKNYRSCECAEDRGKNNGDENPHDYKSCKCAPANNNNMMEPMDQCNCFGRFYNYLKETTNNYAREKDTCRRDKRKKKHYSCCQKHPRCQESDNYHSRDQEICCPNTYPRNHYEKKSCRQKGHHKNVYDDYYSRDNYYQMDEDYDCCVPRQKPPPRCRGRDLGYETSDRCCNVGCFHDRLPKQPHCHRRKSWPQKLFYFFGTRPQLNSDADFYRYCRNNWYPSCPPPPSPRHHRQRYEQRRCCRREQSSSSSSEERCPPPTRRSTASSVEFVSYRIQSMADCNKNYHYDDGDEDDYDECCCCCNCKAVENTNCACVQTEVRCSCTHCGTQTDPCAKRKRRCCKCCKNKCGRCCNGKTTKPPQKNCTSVKIFKTCSTQHIPQQQEASQAQSPQKTECTPPICPNFTANKLQDIMFGEVKTSPLFLDPIFSSPISGRKYNIAPKTINVDRLKHKSNQKLLSDDKRFPVISPQKSLEEYFDLQSLDSGIGHCSQQPKFSRINSILGKYSLDDLEKILKKYSDTDAPKQSKIPTLAQASKVVKNVLENLEPLPKPQMFCPLMKTNLERSTSCDNIKFTDIEQSTTRSVEDLLLNASINTNILEMLNPVDVISQTTSCKTDGDLSLSSTELNDSIKSLPKIKKSDFKAKGYNKFKQVMNFKQKHAEDLKKT